jgi:GNAT superfamily N-acetyltransferase
VFVACEKDDDAVAGFYSLCVGAFAPRDVGEEAEGLFGRVGSVPAIYLAMLGVDQRRQGSGVGNALIRDALGRALHIAQHVGTYMLALDAATDELVGYYRKLGFQLFAEGERRMFIPLATLRAL